MLIDDADVRFIVCVAAGLCFAAVVLMAGVLA